MSQYEEKVGTLLEAWDVMSRFDDTIAPSRAFAYKMDALSKIVAIEIHMGAGASAHEVLSFFTQETRKVLDFLDNGTPFTPQEETLQ